MRYSPKKWRSNRCNTTRGSAQRFRLGDHASIAISAVARLREGVGNRLLQWHCLTIGPCCGKRVLAKLHAGGGDSAIERRPLVYGYSEGDCSIERGRRA